MAFPAHSLAGLHHVSSLSARIGQSHDFYTRVLGMRPLIRTVNQDEPSMYHLFFGDGAGTPGTDMTVFDLPRAARERAGNNSITRTSFRVRGTDALAYWADRFAALGIAHDGLARRDDRAVLDVADWVGTALSLVDDEGAGDAGVPWDASPVPPAHQLRGLGHMTMTVPVLEPTDRFLTDGLGLGRSHEYVLDRGGRARVHVYAMGTTAALATSVARQVHVVVHDDLPRVRPGSGGVHHVALRVSDDASIAAWAAHLDGAGYRNSGVVDRHYFRSVYVREPNQVLFELATDGPGFTVDGPVDGERLSLPPMLAPRRTEIESRLAPLISAAPARGG